MQSIFDPKGMAGDDLGLIDDKLKVARMILARGPDKGGAPFIFAFSSTKNHYLDDVSIPIFVDDQGNEEKWPTAATDGKNYFWHPDFVRSMSPVSLSIFIMHETWHVVLQHCDPHRSFGKNRKIWNYAVDYVVHSMIEHDFRKSGRISDYSDYRNQEHPIWTGEIGKPLYFDDLMKSIKNTKKALEKEIEDIKKGIMPKFKKPVKPKKEDLRRLADYSLFGKSAEEIYNMMMDEFKDMEEAAINFILQNSSDGVQSDDHRIIDLPRSSLLQQILEAATAAKQMSAGSVPAAIEDQLAKLSDPKLSWQDIVRVAFQNRRKEKGSINDWSRFRRRELSLNFYKPKKKDQYIHWLAGLDTSGSMTREDMAYGVSQLKCLDGRSEGTVVCWDAQVYWDKATKIQGMNDLPNISIHGRGGTVIRDLLTDWRKYIREEVDMMIIMTDGYLFDTELKDPGVDVLWVITSENKNFKPPFGRVALLRGF